MPKIIHLVFFMLIGYSASSQRIFLLMNRKENKLFKTAVPRKMTRVATFYRPSYDSYKSILLLDRSGMIIRADNFNVYGIRTSTSTYDNDTIKRIVLSITSEDLADGKPQSITTYNYDANNNLVRMTEKNLHTKKVMNYEIVNNKNGDPVILVTRRDTVITFRETAVYQYDQNRVIIHFDTPGRKYDRFDTLAYRVLNELMIPSEVHAYNDKGDITSWTARSEPGGPKVLFETEYTYDERGNITEQRSFIITTKDDGSKKRKRYSIIKISYIYW